MNTKVLIVFLFLILVCFTLESKLIPLGSRIGFDIDQKQMLRKEYEFITNLPEIVSTAKRFQSGGKTQELINIIKSKEFDARIHNLYHLIYATQIDAPNLRLDPDYIESVVMKLLDLGMFKEFEILEEKIEIQVFVWKCFVKWDNKFNEKKSEDLKTGRTLLNKWANQGGKGFFELAAYRSNGLEQLVKVLKNKNMISISRIKALNILVYHKGKKILPLLKKVYDEEDTNDINSIRIDVERAIKNLESK